MNITQNTSSALSQSKISSLLDAIKTNALTNGGKGDKDAEVKEVFKQFESMFISEMLRQMYSTIPVNELFGGGVGEETFRSMLVDEYGTLIAGNGGIGIADNMQKTLLNQQLTEGSNVKLSEQEPNT